MKVIQVFNQYLNPGGEENSVVRIANHLELGGHEVQRFWKSSEEWIGTGSPPKWKQAMLLGNNNEVLNELREQHESFTPDVWILHNVIPVISLGIYALARELKVPIIQWLHNYRPITLSGSDTFLGRQEYLLECLVGAWRGSRVQTVLLAMHYLRLKFRDDFEAVSLWVAVSDSMKGRFECADWYTEKLATLHHSWDVQNCLPCSNEDGYFLYLGRIVEDKGIRFLIELFSQPNMKSYRLKVAGTGDLEVELKSISGENVEWLGFVIGEDKRRLIRNSSAVLFPSIWNEPLSTVAYEAYEQSRCVICSSQGGMPEIVFDGLTGLVLPPGDLQSWSQAIIGNSTNEFNLMGVNARNWLVANIGPTAWNRKFLEIVNKKITSLKNI